MHLHVEVACLEEKLLQNLAAARAVGLDEYAERECVVYVGLSDVKDLGVVVGEHFGEAGCDAAAVGARYVEQYKFSHSGCFIWCYLRRDFLAEPERLLEWDFLEPDFLLTPLFLVEALLFLADA